MSLEEALQNMQQIYRRTQCQRVISIKLQRNFIENALWHGCFPVNLLDIFRTTFYKNTNEGMLLCLHRIEAIQLKVSADQLTAFAIPTPLALKKLTTSVLLYK